MGKCMICGKRGLFLKVDALGRCNECAQKEREKEAAEAREKAEKEEQEFESYYSNMLFCLKKLQEDIEVDDNPIEAFCAGAAQHAALGKRQIPLWLPRAEP